MNQLPHFLADIDGVRVHFVYVKAEKPTTRAMVLTHGWPGSFWDFSDVIPMLAAPSRFGGNPDDSCNVVAPSLPGYDFSAPTRGVGGGFVQTADLWHRLMTEGLDYRRYAAHGYDWGGFVTAQLGHRYGAALDAVHLTSAMSLESWSTDRPYADVLGAVLASAPGEDRAGLIEWERARASHMAVHLIEPQTLAYALHDSPVALLAWLFQRRIALSDARIAGNRAVDPDDVITLAMLSWVTGSAGSSIRYYRESSINKWSPSHEFRPTVQAPAGISIFTEDRPRNFRISVSPDHYDVVYSAEHDKGGHFPSVECPQVLAADILATLRAAAHRRLEGVAGAILAFRAVECSTRLRQDPPGRPLTMCKAPLEKRAHCGPGGVRTAGPSSASLARLIWSGRCRRRRPKPPSRLRPPGRDVGAYSLARLVQGGPVQARSRRS
jgi:pimeloyl-ACP methyl ester carboxylesterase